MEQASRSFLCVITHFTTTESLNATVNESERDAPMLTQSFPEYEAT
jgi:hypothetical protein